MPSDVLLTGTIGADGRIDARPVIVTLNDAGRVIAWRPLDGHEPHSTTFRPALLHLPSLEIRE